MLFSVLSVYVRRGSPQRKSEGTGSQTPERAEQQAGSSSEDMEWKPFDVNVISLPRNYEGLDTAKLSYALLGRRSKEFKDKYESTDEHRKRVALLDKAPIIGEISLQSTVALPVQILEKTRFDADLKKLVVEVDFDDSMGISDTVKNTSALRGFASSAVRSKHTTYTGTNAFGVEVQVTRTEEDVYEVLFPKNGRHGVVFQLPASKSDAPELEKSLRVIAVCRLRKPYMQLWGFETKPTIAKPEEDKYSYYYISAIISEFWLYDIRDGKIIQRMKTSGR